MCSGNYDSTAVNQVPQTGGTVSFKINGVQKTFNNVLVNTEVESEGETWLTVTVSQDGNPAETLRFSGYEGEIGSIAMTQWNYKSNGKHYIQAGTGFISSIVQVNQQQEIKRFIFRIINNK